MNSCHRMTVNIIVHPVGIGRGPGSDDVRAALVEAMKAKYANIDIDEEVDRWLGVKN